MNDVVLVPSKLLKRMNALKNSGFSVVLELREDGLFRFKIRKAKSIPP